MSKVIVVVGSSNTDMVLKTTRFPKPGETILGGDFFMFQGGKGANQAVASARLGGEVIFICKVGVDLFGDNAIRHYKDEGIDAGSILQTASAPTGVALITVDAAGENEIVVASGANALLSPADLEEAEEALGSANYILTQLETPITSIEFLAVYAKRTGKKLVLNPAPATQLPAVIYDGLFLITPNETEAELLTGIQVSDEQTAQEASTVFKNKGVRNVIITMGSKGAYASCDHYTGLVSAPKVQVVDSTAAGDVFNGAIVVALSEGMGWKAAVEFACSAAAVSVTIMGAQSSAPYRKDVVTI